MKKNIPPFLLFLVILFSGHTSIAQAFEADDENIKYTGRIDFSDPKVAYFGFAGVKIEAKFEGTSITAYFDVTKGSLSDTLYTTYYYKIVDGGVPEKFPLLKDQATYIIASGLAETEHTVELIKLTETSTGTVKFKGFDLDAGKSLLSIPPTQNLKFMAIGASTTAGYGLEGSYTNEELENGKGKYACTRTNNYKSFGSITARHFDGDYVNVAAAGHGLFQNGEGSTDHLAPDYFDRIFFNVPGSTWDHSKYIPDYVIINIASNDFTAETANDAFKFDETKYKSKYKSFINKIRNVYCGARIIVTVGHKSDWNGQWTRWQNYTKNMIDELNSTGETGVYYLAFKPQSEPYGDLWHASEFTHQQMADSIIALIENVQNDGFTCDPNAIRLTLNSDKGLAIPSPDKGVYHFGQSVTLTATPDDGFEFVSWSGDLNSSENPVNVTMDSSKVITAIFKKEFFGCEYFFDVLSDGKFTTNSDASSNTVIDLTNQEDSIVCEWTKGKASNSPWLSYSANIKPENFVNTCIIEVKYTSTRPLSLILNNPKYVWGSHRIELPIATSATTITANLEDFAPDPFGPAKNDTIELAEISSMVIAPSEPANASNTISGNFTISKLRVYGIGQSTELTPIKNIQVDDVTMFAIDDKLNIISQDDGTFDFTIYTINGRVVKSEKMKLVKGNNTSTLGSSLSSGMYLMRLTNSEKSMVKRVFIN